MFFRLELIQHILFILGIIQLQWNSLLKVHIQLLIKLKVRRIRLVVRRIRLKVRRIRLMVIKRIMGLKHIKEEHIIKELTKDKERIKVQIM